MLETGSIVKATVTQIAPYGVYFGCDGDSILVVASNLSWRGEDEDELHVGDVVDVQIVGYSEDKQVYVGSCKATRPESNPYKRFSSKASPSETFLGQVQVVHTTGLSVKVGECIGILPYDETSNQLSVGDHVRVTVESVDPNRQFLEFRISESH